MKPCIRAKPYHSSTLPVPRISRPAHKFRFSRLATNLTLSLFLKARQQLPINPMTIPERKQKLGNILELLQTSQYRYDLSKTAVNGKTQMPPPPGTGMSCGSAARIFMQLAKDMGIDGLQSLFYDAPQGTGGYFVLDRGSDHALGNGPQIVGVAFKGWEFENHYRVKDPQTSIVYDPTFGTSSADPGGNPTGYKATSEITDPKTFTMTSIYATRYQVKRKGVMVETQELNKNAVPQTNLILDSDFALKPMDNLR